MRKAFSLLVAAVLIVAVVAWWTAGGSAFSIVPGWHTPILSPIALLSILVSAVLLTIAAAIIFTQLRGASGIRERVARD